MDEFDNLNDSFGSFGNNSDDGFSFSSGSFGNDSSMNFGDHDDEIGEISLNDGSQGQNFIPDNAFDGQFDDNAGISNDQNYTNDGGLKKKALLTAAIGLAGVVLVLFIAAKINKAAQDKNIQNNQSQVQVQTQNQNQNQGNNNINVNDIISTQSQQSQQVQQQVQKPTAVTTVTDNEFNWVVITDSENVAFNDQYTEMTFTITGITHYARSVDVNDNLVVKTTLTGSISGLSGTYSLDVPYNKGTKLVVGNNFTVQVQLGTYNDKTVVGDIRY